MKAPAKSGLDMYVGAALDGRTGPVMSVRLFDGTYHLQKVASLSKADGKARPKVAASRRGDIVGRVFEMHIDEGELYVAWEGDERTKLLLPPGGLPERVRPWLKLSFLNDAIELAGIIRRGRPGAALAFALVLKRISERVGQGEPEPVHIPMELASRIWSMSIVYIGL